MSVSPFKSFKKAPHILGAFAPEVPPPQSQSREVDPTLEVTLMPEPTRNVRAIARAVLEAHLPDWVVREGQKSRPLTTSANLAALMALGGWKVRYNEMTRRTELFKDGVISPRDDDLNTALTLLGDWAVMHGLNRENVPELVDAIAKQAPYHPVRDWIKSKPWDEVDRIELFADTLELENTSSKPLAHRLLHKWLLQGVGALMEPDGLSASGMLVLAGPQYAGKTYWTKNLCPLPGAVVEGVTLDPCNKDSVLRATGAFITEVGELDGTMRKADIAQFKGFLTNNTDEVRLPYARRASFYKRRTNLAGTVNESGFLVDETGNRRFWVVVVKRCTILPPHVMQQVWAQYLHLYERSERWGLEPELLQALNASNRNHETVDPLAERIASAFDWGSVDLGTVTEENRTSHVGVQWLTATRICEMAGVLQPKKSEATRAARIVKCQWDLQGHLSGNLGEVALLDRRANGLRLLAVPKKRAFSG